MPQPSAIESEPDEEEDALGSYEDAAISAFKGDEEVMRRLRGNGIPWKGVLVSLRNALPDVLSDRDQIAHGLVPKAMNRVFGQQNTAWKTEKRPAKTRKGYNTTRIVIIDADVQATTGSAIE